MMGNFPYWTELRAWLKQFWPIALNGYPQVSTTQATFYNTAADWKDPGGAQWRLYPWGYATGGPVVPGRPIMLGERNMPELYMPKRAGNIFPLMPSMQGAGGNGFQTANIYVELDGRTIARAISAPLVKEIRLRTGIKY